MLVIFHGGLRLSVLLQLIGRSAMLQHDGRIQSKSAAALVVRIGLFRSINLKWHAHLKRRTNILTYIVRPLARLPYDLPW